MTSNDLDRACAQVGLFMYHFANLENQIDAAVAKLFELKDNTAQMINGSVDFFKRYNLVHTAVHYQVDENEYKRLKKILTKVTDHNKHDRSWLTHALSPSVMASNSRALLHEMAP